MKIQFNTINILISIILSIFFILSERGQTAPIQKFKITAISEKRNIPLNREFTVVVTVSYIGEPGDYIISDPLVEKYYNLELAGNSTEGLVKNTAENSNLKEVIKNYVFILKPQSLGQAYFPIVRIAVNDKTGKQLTELATQPITITIEEPIVKKDYSLLFMILLILIVFSGVLFLIRYILLKKTERIEAKRIEDEKLKNQKTPEQEFQDELNDLQNLMDIDKISPALVLLKKYFEKKFNHHFKDKSSNEIVNYLRNKEITGKEIIDRLEEILKESDLIKFGAEKPDAEKISNILESISGIVQGMKEIKKEDPSK